MFKWIFKNKTNIPTTMTYNIQLWYFIACYEIYVMINIDYNEYLLILLLRYEFCGKFKLRQMLYLNYNLLFLWYDPTILQVKILLLFKLNNFIFMTNNIKKSNVIIIINSLWINHRK